MKAADRAFFANFLVVIAALVALAIFVGVAASWINSAENEKNGIDPRAASQIAERIAPAGQVAVGQPPAEDAPVTKAEAKAPRSGAEIANGVCMGCHGAGIAGAPKVGDNAAWAALWANGLEATVSNAINGKGGMPPRGGSDATDDELRAAVIYLFKQAGIE